MPRATYYRHVEAQAPAPRPTPAQALTGAERRAVLDVLHEPRFADQAPAEVYARLLDENGYLCSERTMYQSLLSNDNPFSEAQFKTLKYPPDSPSASAPRHTSAPTAVPFRLVKPRASPWWHRAPHAERVHLGSQPSAWLRELAY